MKKIIDLLLLILFSTGAFSQLTDIVHKEKINTILFIIDNIRKNALKNQELIVYLDANYKEHSTSKGFAGTHIEYSSNFMLDTMLLKEIEQHYLQKKLKLSVKPKNSNTTRNSLLSETLSDTNYLHKQILLIEIFSPFDGWNVLDLFYSDMSSGFSGVPFMYYYTNDVSIPVFVYSNDLKEEKKKWLLFSFELIFENDKLFLKLKKIYEL